MKIAIIGSGISGLGAAYLLHKEHHITLYEKNDYVGGHSRTVTINIDGQAVPVDTGFIVFNHRNYPHLTALFKQLDVPTTPSDMSFGVSINNGWLEYGTRRPLDIFAQKRNLLRPQFLTMLYDIVRFNKNAARYIESDITLGECLAELGLSQWFCHYYVLAMGASIWSTPIEGMLDFPARSFIRFFENHGLLTINDQPQWYTVKGGSQEYVKRITAPFNEHICHHCGIESVIRHDDSIEVIDQYGTAEHYDHVIFACHSDQILPLLNTPTQQETSLLSAIPYQPNEMVLHSDTRLMPKRKSAWSSWVYLSEEREDSTMSVSLSYWMNNLQPLPTNTPIIVTLNPATAPAADKVYDSYQFHHPVFNANAIKAQQHIDQIQGADRIWYSGAWLRYGFHEDGLLSAVNIAKKIGVSIPWT